MNSQPSTRRAVKPTEKARAAAEDISSRPPRKRQHSASSDGTDHSSSAQLHKEPRTDNAARSAKNRLAVSPDLDKDSAPAATGTDCRERSPSIVEIDSPGPVNAQDELS